MSFWDTITSKVSSLTSSRTNGASYTGINGDDSDSTSVQFQESSQRSTFKVLQRRRNNQNCCSVMYAVESCRGCCLSFCSSPLGCQYFIPYLQPPRVPLSTLALNDTQRTRIRALRKKVSVTFDATNEAHHSELFSLGTAIFGDDFTSPETVKSAKWKTIGFQGTNPSTDFRSAGLFGLQNLIYLVHIEPRVIKRMIQMEHVSLEYYLPFAIACLNITYSLVSMLQLNVAWTTKLTAGEADIYEAFAVLLETDEFAFEEIYRSALQYLLDVWTDTHAKYFQFTEVLLRTKEKIAEVLMCRPTTMAEFNRILSCDGDTDEYASTFV